MRSKILAAFVAGGLLVGAGFLTSVISAPGTAQALEETDDPGPAGSFPRVLRLLDEVLDDLVADDTLTQEQADSVSEAAAEKAEDVVSDIREHRREWRPFARGFRFGALLDDGGIDQEEYDALPDRHPMKDLDMSEQLADGVITPDELGQVLSDFLEDH